MKYKLRYTAMALFFCALLGWDLSYEYQKPEPIASAATPHPVVHSIKHLIAPAYTPPTDASTTEATSSIAVSATSTDATASSSQPISDTSGATSTPQDGSGRGRSRRINVNGIGL